MKQNRIPVPQLHNAIACLLVPIIFTANLASSADVPVVGSNRNALNDAFQAASSYR